MRRRVKYIRQRQGGKTYTHPWIGYSYRNERGTPDFKREVSLCNFTEAEVTAIEVALRNGEALDAGAPQPVEFIDSLSIGAPWVALELARKLGIVEELERFEQKHREPLLAMILDRVVNALPHSKLSLYETLPGSGLEQVVFPGGTVAALHDFYAALPKLYAAQMSIQKGLFARQDKPHKMFLYDITSSYMEGTKCPISEFGYNRDGKKGKQQIVIGLLTDMEGLPVAVQVFDGNTSDQTTVMGQVDSLRNDFGAEELVFVGDRGMLTQARRRDLEQDGYEKVKYISALNRNEFFRFLDDQNHPLQLSIFDRQELVEVAYEGTRYVLSFNPQKEDDDRRTRLRLLDKTEEKLVMIKRNVDAGKWKKPDVIARKMYRWVNNWSMAKFFTCEYSEGSFSYVRNEELIKQFEAIDGFYVIITDTDVESFSTAETRGAYKSLIQVEQAFRAMKTADLFVRPIRHWSPDHVKGHVFVCTLAYMIVWEARRCLGQFIDPDPVEPMDEDFDPNLSCHSLRTLWDKLNHWVKIAKLKIGGKMETQLKPLTTQAKQILKAAGVKTDAAAKARFGIVG